jgi:hypothetical protein
MWDLRFSQQRLVEVLKCFGGSIFHWNISKCLPDYMASHPENSFFIKFSDNILYLFLKEESDNTNLGQWNCTLEGHMPPVGQPLSVLSSFLWCFSSTWQMNILFHNTNLRITGLCQASTLSSCKNYGKQNLVCYSAYAVLCIWIHSTHQSLLECKLAVTWDTHIHTHIHNW